MHYRPGVDSGEEVYCENLSKTDFGDIRFTDNDGVSELDYWMEELHVSDYAMFWVEVADSLNSNQTIFLYFGNPDAVDASDGESTFVVWDDFDLGYTVGDSPKSLRGWFILDKETNDLLEVATNPTGRGGNGLRYKNVDTAGPTMAFQNTWSQELSVALHLKLYWDVRDGQFRYDIRDIDDGASFVATWSDYASSYILTHRDSPTTHLAYSPAYELLEDEWYNIESQCEFDAHSLIVNNTILSGDVRRPGDGYDHIWIYGHEDYLDDFYIDDFFVRKFVSSEPAHGVWGIVETPETLTTTPSTPPPTGPPIDFTMILMFGGGIVVVISLVIICRSRTPTPQTPSSYDW